MEKQVGFQGRVDVVSMTPGWPMAILPDHVFRDDGIPSSGELGWSRAPVPKTSSTAEYSSFGLLRSIQKGSSKHNFGYSTAERPNKPGLWFFSNDGYDSGMTGCAWVHDQHRRWSVACWTCIALLSLLILAALAVVLTWCIIIPKRPFLELLEAQLEEPYNVSQAPASASASLRVTANFTLHVKNPNRVAADYSSSRFSVAYRDSSGDGVVGNGTMAAFSQHAHASTQHPLVVHIMLNDTNVNGSIPLEVYGRVHARLQVLGLSTPPVLINLRCSVEIKALERVVTIPECRIAKHKIVW